MRRFLLSVLLISVCVTGILTSSSVVEASASKRKYFDDYSYVIREDKDGKYAVITGTKIGLRGANSIPDEINGIPVKEIGADAFRGQDAYCVTLPEQIRMIGNRAFADNEELWGVYISNADCVIGEDAFYRL